MFHEGVCPATRTHAPNWVAEHLGASSRRPGHPFPALMAGEPQAVYLCTRPKNLSRQNEEPRTPTVRSHSFLHVLTPCPVTKQRACNTVQELHLCTHHLDGHVSVQIQLPLLTATLVLQHEPGKVVVIWANIVITRQQGNLM